MSRFGNDDLAFLVVGPGDKFDVEDLAIAVLGFTQLEARMLARLVSLNGPLAVTERPGAELTAVVRRARKWMKAQGRDVAVRVRSSIDLEGIT